MLLSDCVALPICIFIFLLCCFNMVFVSLQIPSYKNFKGGIEELDETRCIINGEVSIIDDTTIEINELPVKTWTQTYKEQVLEPMLTGTDKIPPMIQ